MYPYRPGPGREKRVNLTNNNETYKMGTMKEIYHPAAILRRISLQTEGDLLSGSVVDKMQVQSAGQEVEEYDFSTSPFNHSWEE